MIMHGYDMKYIVIFNDETHCFDNRLEASELYESKKKLGRKADLVEMFENTKGLATS